MLKMNKLKKLSNQHIKTTIIFGYILFALTILSYLLTTAIPFGFSLQYPTARHLNIIVLIVVFGMSAILPAFVSYLIGDRVTHAKDRTLHHYNGVLFGIAAYWVAILFSWIGFSSISFVSAQPYPIPLIVGNVLPVIFTIILMASVAVNYSKSASSRAPLLLYKPFQIVLIVSVVTGFVYPYATEDFTGGIVATLGTLLVPIAATAFAYKVLAKNNVTRLARLSDALVAMTMGWITIWLANTLIVTAMREPSQVSFQIAGIVAYVVGLIVFLVYIYLQLFLHSTRS